MAFGNGKLREAKLLPLANVESLATVLTAATCLSHSYKLNFRYLSNVFKTSDKGESITQFNDNECPEICCIRTAQHMYLA